MIATTRYGAPRLRSAVLRAHRQAFSSAAASSSSSYSDDGDHHHDHHPVMFSSMEEFFNPTETHHALREMLRDFVQKEVGAERVLLLLL
jgi:hypothetical protein